MYAWRTSRGKSSRHSGEPARQAAGDTSKWVCIYCGTCALEVRYATVTDNFVKALKRCGLPIGVKVLLFSFVFAFWLNGTVWLT